MEFLFQFYNALYVLGYHQMKTQEDVDLLELEVLLSGRRAVKQILLSLRFGR